MTRFARSRLPLAGLALCAAMSLGACEHYEYGYKPQPEAQMPVAQAYSSTQTYAMSMPASGEPNPCADSFNAALDNLIAAMEQTRRAQENVRQARMAAGQ